MSHRPVRRRSALRVALGCALVLLLTGCSSESLSALWPEPTPSWTPTPVPGADQRSLSSDEASPSDGGSQDPDESEQPPEEDPGEVDYFPGVRPANGPVVRMEAIAYRLPRSMQVRDRSEEVVSAQNETVTSLLTVSEVPAVWGGDLDELAEVFAEGLQPAERYQRGGPLVTSVCTMFSFYGVNPRTGTYHRHASCEFAGRTLIFTASATGEGRQKAADTTLFQTLETVRPR